jgi:hypothetical protein
MLTIQEIEVSSQLSTRFVTEQPPRREVKSNKQHGRTPESMQVFSMVYSRAQIIPDPLTRKTESHILSCSKFESVVDCVH